MPDCEVAKDEGENGKYWKVEIIEKMKRKERKKRKMKLKRKR